MHLSYLDINIACSVLNNDEECTKMLQSIWPFYNASRSDENQLKMEIRKDAVSFSRLGLFFNNLGFF